MKPRQMKRVLSKAKIRPKIFIETGTADGKNVEAMAELFDKLHTIELSLELYLAYQRTTSKISPWHGNSVEQLHSLLGWMKDDTPVVFYLDAHYCKGYAHEAAKTFPLWHELHIIKERKCADIVIVDDVHTFGKDRPDLGTNEWQHVTKESLLAAMTRVVKSFTIADEFVMIREEAKP